MTGRTAAARLETASVLQTRLKALGQGPDDDIDIAEAALMFAALMHPGANLEPSRQHLVAIADGLARAVEAAGEEAESAGSRAGLLAAEMAGTWSYKGDVESYEDPGNADIMQVIDRRLGLPVTLGILYLHAARAQGWQADGLNFPGHFLIRLEGEDGDRVILDPFHDGAIVPVHELRALLKAITGPAAELTPEAYAPASNRDVLLRLQSNVKLRALEGGRIDEALAAIERMLLIAPEDYRLWREAGLLHMRHGDLEGAIAALDDYLRLAPHGADRERIRKVIEELHDRLP